MEDGERQNKLKMKNEKLKNKGKKQKVVFVGGGKLAAILYFMFKDSYDFIGYLDDFSDKAYIEESCGIKKLGTSNDLKKILPLTNKAVISIGSIGNTKARLINFENLKKAGFNFPTLVSPKAIVAENVSIGEGTIIEHNVVVNPSAKIGSNCVISNNSVIGHDLVIGNNVFIAAGVTTNGDSSIGDNTFIGTGATVIQKLKIGKDCLIGAASCVTKDVRDNSKVAGVPARPIKI